MSFRQIFDRITRIARAGSNDAFGGRSRYDEELRRAQELIDGEKKKDEGQRTKDEGGEGMGEERACRILGVAVSASMQEITVAYRKRMLTVHPDRHAHRSPEAEAEALSRARELNEAYAFLKQRRT